MALSAIIRRAASTVAPLAVRAAIGNQRNYSSAIITPLKNSLMMISDQKSFLPSVQFFSSAVAKKKSSTSDETLVRVIESEIECAKESVTTVAAEGEGIPAGFPFKIEDNPGEQTITLKREYQGEVVKVQVHMPDLVTGNEEEDDDDDDDGVDGEKGSQSSIPLVVTVSKENGPSLEFSVMAYPDEISIDSLSVKQPETSEDQISYEGPDFTDLDENLQKAFHKYLEIRGIKPSTTNFLHEYMIDKDSREYLMWLKNLKSFVQH